MRTMFYDVAAAQRDQLMMQFFEYAHLPAPLQKVSAPFCELAKAIAAVETGLPANAQRSLALEHLLAAKDAAVRAHIMKGPG